MCPACHFDSRIHENLLLDLLWVSIWYIEILFLSLRPNWTKHLNMNKIYTINDIKKQNALVTCGIPVVHVHWFSGFI